MNLKLTIPLILAPLVTGCGLIAASSSVPEQEAAYIDPGGLFSVTVPTSWTTESEETYGVLTSPDEDVSAFVVVVDANNIEEVGV